MKGLHQRGDTRKRRHKKKRISKRTTGLKERLKLQLETVKKEKEDADQQLVILNKQNLTLKR